jgi:hypothetical protein
MALPDPWRLTAHKFQLLFISWRSLQLISFVLVRLNARPIVK